MRARQFIVSGILGAVLVAGTLSPSHAKAELTPEDLEQVGTPNDAYTDAVWGKGIQSEIVYIRPSVEFVAGDGVTIEVPEQPKTEAETTRQSRIIFGLILAAILAVIVYVFVTNAGAVGATFRPTSEAKRRSGIKSAEDPDHDLADQPLEQFLARLSAMSDKREALILLVSRALEWAADRNELRLGRSQTARDVLRILPSDWPDIGELSGLVREAEVVHFGGRDLSHDRWEDCLSAARRIFRGPAQ